MAGVVQATCPGCKNVLRIPTDWLGQAFKCKHCGIVIQARGPAEAPAAAKSAAAKPAARPVAKPVAVPAKSSKAAPADPFAFDEDAPVVSRRPRARRRSGCGVAVALFAVVLVGGLALLAWALSSHLSELKQKLTDQPVAQNNDDPGQEGTAHPRESAPPEGPITPPAPRDTGKKTDLPIKHETGRRPENPRPETAPRRDPPGKPADLPVAAGSFPRRALAVSINNYLFANPINYGMPLANAANVQTLLDRFTRPAALHIPADQVALLSDAAPDRVAVPPTEGVIRSTVVNFLDTSRAQDRIILLIIGHVVEIDGEPILLPIDGSADTKEGGIPLRWVYERLAACKARQKLLILDTCRLDPAKGQERPGSGPMGEKLDAMLKEPPPGVQVWSSCVAGQYSYEFEGGDINNGLFLEELYNVVEDLGGGKIQSAADPLPLGRLVPAVNAAMKGVLAPLGKVQTSRLTGSAPEDGAAPDPKEPAPPRPRVARPVGLRGGTADLTTVRSILKDVSFPPLKVAKDQKPLTAEALPPFPAETLKEYLKDGEATPLRAEVQKARELLSDIAGRNKLTDSYRAIAEGPLKKQVRDDQKKVAMVIGALQEEYDALKAVAEHRKDETRRWQATYDYVVARLEAQLAYLNEYQAVLGQILKGMAAPDPNVYSGWRLASQYDPQTGDSAAKKMATDSRKKLDKIIAAYPNTPWAVMARRDKASALGLEWQPMKK